MSQLDSLLAAVCAAPEDMAARRAYAAAVKSSDPARAKLIDLQLAIREARRRGEDPDTAEASALVRQHGEAWAGTLARQTEYIGYWGGFVEEIEVSAMKLIASHGAFARLAPLRHFRIRELRGHVAETAALPILAQARSLDVQSCRLTDVDLAELVRSPRIRGVRILRVGNNPEITIDGLRMVARADLPDLRFVETQLSGAPLIDITSDWTGAVTSIDYTSVRDTLVDEFGHLKWLDAGREPSQDVI